MSVDRASKDFSLRSEVLEMLTDGLATDVWPRADGLKSIEEITGRLREQSDSEVAAKVRIAGFTTYPVSVEGFEQACETCMYYLNHRRFCQLPELMLPVEASWSCRLWRI